MEIKNNDTINIIERIEKNSIADELNIEAGDTILAINGRPILDIIDYMYQVSDEYIELDIQKTNGQLITYEIEKDYNEDLGIEFMNPLIDKAKHCSNKCIFCFIDQLPPNMRETLYFKDDDSRLSFLQGNFITLTNMSDDEIERIIEYRISPINVSVHTTNPELRVRMLKNKNAGRVYEILEKFNEANLEVNVQIVCVPGVNDKEELERTVMDLSYLDKSVKSIAIVPVGVTKFREGLFQVKAFDKAMSLDIIEQIENLQEKFLKEKSTRFVFLSDEFYVLAGKEVPSDEEYEDYPQIENGVGLMRNFKEELIHGLEGIDRVEKTGEILFITGTLANDYMLEIKELLRPKFPNLEITVFPIQNDFFGHTITVAGLVTGGDIIKQVKNNKIKNTLIPDVMLRAETDYFLDDVKIKDIEKALDTSIKVTKVDGYEFIKNLMELVE